MVLGDIVRCVAAAIVFVGLCLLPPMAGAQPTEGYEEPPFGDGGLPIIAEATVGQHRLRAIIDAKIVLKDADLSEYGEGCYPDDMLNIKVYRDGTEIYSEDYCSAYRVASAKFYPDAHGIPFLARGEAFGHGTQATTHVLRFYEFGERVEEWGGFYSAFWVTPEDTAVFDYKVTAPPGGGLIVDIKARDWASYPSDCCYDMKETDQILMGAAASSKAPDSR